MHTLFGPWLVAFCIIVVGCNTTHKTHEDAYHVKCVLVAVRNYNNVFRSLPQAVIRADDGTPRHSWRYAIGWFLDSQAFGYIEPSSRDSWDSAKFSEWRSVRQSCLCEEDTTDTSIVAVVGEGTVMGGNQPLALSEIPSDAVLILYAPAMRMHWMEPSDPQLTALQASGAKSVGSYFGQGFLVGTADGRVVRIRDEVLVQELIPFLIADSERRSNLEEIGEMVDDDST